MYVCMDVCMFVCMYVCMYIYICMYVCLYACMCVCMCISYSNNKNILYTCYIVLLIFYSYICLLWYSFVLYSFNYEYFDCIQREQLTTSFLFLYTQCLRAGESKVLLLCSVMSVVPVSLKNSLGILDDFRQRDVL